MANAFRFYNTANIFFKELALAEPTTVNCTDTFNAGTINVMYEG